MRYNRKSPFEGTSGIIGHSPAPTPAPLPPSFSTTKPNVLMLVVDDLRPELGSFGAKHMYTPVSVLRASLCFTLPITSDLVNSKREVQSGGREGGGGGGGGGHSKQTETVRFNFNAEYRRPCE